ncbi:MAG TPA: hypothetical protein VMF89_35505 [Polyangiales bacterium]|nr:hypothetical protein [Polyangiales bacterium]
MNKRPITVAAGLLVTLSVLALGYVSFGFWTMLVFASGFLGGFILWLVLPTRASFASIKAPYVLSLCLFLAHRVEEKMLDFFKRLADITGQPTPAIISWSVILLVVGSVGAWLLVPYFVKRGQQIGHYLASTFFASLGITELAHFIFPLFTEQPYGYFPGMASAAVLAPAAWWGMFRLYKPNVSLTHS